MKIFLLLLTLLAYNILQSQSYHNRHTISQKPFGAGIVSLQTADLDQDGDDDIVLSSYGDQKIIWIENLGNNSFSIARTIADRIDEVETIVLIDIDFDEDLDIFYASWADHEIGWIENFGEKKFSRKKVISRAVFNAVGLSVADLDNDGDLDILGSSNAKDELFLFENIGNNIFQSAVSINNSLNGIGIISAGDIDDDGDDDIIASTPADNTLIWIENLGGLNFGNPLNLASSLIPFDNDLYDIDYDGDLDIIGTDFSSDEVFWIENLGNKRFSSKNQIHYANNPNTIHLVDINRDGMKDVVTSASIGNEIKWSQNNGNKTFSSAISIFSGSQLASSVSSSDFDNDGDIDLVSSSFNDNKLYLHENIGNLVFNTKEISNYDYPGGRIRNVETADLNNDGLLDVLTTSSSGNKLGWFKNLGNKSFSTLKSFSTIYGSSYDIKAADLDNDNDLDVVGAFYNDDAIVWFENLGADTFSTEKIIAGSGNGPRSIAIADYNSDGNLDVASASSINDEIIVSFNTGNGNSFNPISLGTESNGSLYVTDLDGDNDIDLVSILHNNAALIYYENLGNNNFSSWRILSTGNILRFTVIDVDNDNDDDFIGYNSNNQLFLIRNNNGLNFSNRQSINFNSSSTISDIYSFRYDNDSYADILISTNSPSGKFNWLRNLGNNSFSNRINIPYASETLVLSSGDLDNDNDIDILGVDRNNEIFWIENEYNSKYKKAITSCQGYKPNWSSTSLSRSGIYYDTTISAGRTNISILDLSIIPVRDTGISRNAFTLTSNNSNSDAYQWVNCDSNYQFIAGARSKDYTVSENGNYAVILYTNKCIDTSSCFRISNVGLQENNYRLNFSIHPVPATNYLKVSFNNLGILKNLIHYEILTAEGRSVKNGVLNDVIETQHLNSGLYFLKLRVNNQQYIDKFIIE